MRTRILGLALTLWAGAAFAQGPPAAPLPTPSTSAGDAAVSTAPGVADQIDAFIKSAPIPDVTGDSAPGVTSSREPQSDRRIHGVVEVGIGSNGYRHAYGRATMPLGDTGSLSVAIDESRLNGRFRRGPYVGDTLGVSAAFRTADPLNACRPRFNDLGEPLYGALSSGAPGACRAMDRTGP